MSNKIEVFKKALKWERFVLRQSLISIENFREIEPKNSTKERQNAWLDRERADIVNKLQCIHDTIKAYGYTFCEGDTEFLDRSKDYE
jgi:hypothetical protein